MRTYFISAYEPHFLVSPKIIFVLVGLFSSGWSQQPVIIERYQYRLEPPAGTIYLVRAGLSSPY